MVPLGVVSYRNAVTHNIKINVKCGPHKRDTHDVLEIDPAGLEALQADPLDVGMSLGELEHKRHAGPAIQCVHLVCIHVHMCER